MPWRTPERTPTGREQLDLPEEVRASAGASPPVDPKLAEPLANQVIMHVQAYVQGGNLNHVIVQAQTKAGMTLFATEHRPSLFQM